MTIKIYHNPRCTKSRQALELLQSKNINPEIILYLENPPTIADIKEILKLLKASPLDIIRKKEAEFKEQNLSDKSSDEELIKAIARDPKLLERPIVINGDKAAIGRPLENIVNII
jgi:arsenate reductase